MPVARRAALVLALGLVIAVVVVGSAEGRDDAPRAGGDGGAAVVARHDAVQPATVRLDREHRRESLTSQRSVKHLLIVVVLVAGVWAASVSGARRAIAGRGFRPPSRSWWFRGGGRAPPRRFQLSVI